MVRDSRTFVPPEPSATPARIDWRHIPHWAKTVALIAMIIVGVIGIWIEIHAKP